MAKKPIDGGCCGKTPGELSSGEDYAGCIPYEGFERLLPIGYVGGKLVGIFYRNIYGKEMNRQTFYDWTAQEGKGIDPVEALRDRLQDAGLYTIAKNEPLIK